MSDQTEIVKGKKTALQSMAARLQVTPETLQRTLQATAFKECKTQEEFIAAVIVANAYKLNPLLKEIYAFPNGKGGVSACVPIDGWVSLVNRRPENDGVELVENREGDKVVSVTAKFYIKGKAHPIIVTEYMEECFDASKGPWVKWPIRMLRHKAYIQGARLAYGLSGIYDPDEAERIAEAQLAEKRDEIPMPKEIAAVTMSEEADALQDAIRDAQDGPRIDAIPQAIAGDGEAANIWPD